jgi:hypothetical protein
MTAPLLSLPEDILCSIANCLLPIPEQNKRAFHYSHDWLNFMNSNKEHFGNWKKESQIIVLTGSNAKRFRDLKEFRERIYQCVENPRFQLDIFLKKEGGCPPLDLQLFDKVRKIVLIDFDCVAPPTMDVDEISLVECRIQEFSFCSNIKSVTVIQVKEPIRNFDFSIFRNSENGSFRLNTFSSTANHYQLCNLKSLLLRGCSAITDVSCFQNIPHLTLICCNGITDVSSLGKVQTLSLIGCKNVHDVSALGRVHTLDLTSCRRVTDLSALECLIFYGFKGTDLSGLKNIVILDIFYASCVADITMLRSLQVLKIDGCRGITSLSGLSKLKELWIDESDAQRITSGDEVFPRVMTLYLVGFGSSPCNKFLLSLDHIQDLELSRSFWNDLSCISFLSGLRSLTISDCNGFTTLPHLSASLGYLEINDCNLVSLSIARKEENSFQLYELIIEDCLFLTYLQIDEKVFKCKISSCKLLTTVVVNEQIGHLRIQNVESLEKIVNWSKLVCPALFFSQERLLTVDPGRDELLVG